MQRSLVLCLMPVAAALLGGAMPSDPLRLAIVDDARAVTPAALTFDRTTTRLRMAPTGDTRTTIVDRWNGRQWSVVSVNGRKPTAEERSAQRRGDVPGYHDLARLLATATDSRVEADGRTVLVVPMLPAGSVVADGNDISGHLKAEAVIANRAGRPWVQSLHVTARETFKLNQLIRVKKFEQVNEYRIDASGMPRLVAQQNDSIGSMFGFSGGEKRSVSFEYR